MAASVPFRTEPAGVEPSGVVPQFNLAGSQRPTFNAWLPLKQLQSEMDQRKKANMLLVHSRQDRSASAAANLRQRKKQYSERAAHLPDKTP